MADFSPNDGYLRGRVDSAIERVAKIEEAFQSALRQSESDRRELHERDASMARDVASLRDDMRRELTRLREDLQAVRVEVDPIATAYEKTKEARTQMYSTVFTGVAISIVSTLVLAVLAGVIHFP